MPRKNKKSVRPARSPGATEVKRPISGSAKALKPEAVPSTADSLVASMSSHLRAEYRHLKSALTAASTKSVTSKHKVALIVLRVKNKPKRYGQRAVAQLEAALGLDSKSLYRWAAVAEAWPSRSSLEKVLSKKNDRGLPLTWSHLELLSEIEDLSKRTRALDGAVRQSWSVRQLRAWITGLHKSGDAKPPEAAKSVEDRIIDLAKRTEDAAWDLEAWHATLSQLPSGPPLPVVVESLKRAQAVHLRLKDACAHTLDEIGALLARSSVVAQPPSATSTVAPAAA